MAVASVLWRRLDSPGHDACRLEKHEDGWRLDGAAVFLRDWVPARLTYDLTCDLSWRTQYGQVLGWIGAQAIEISIARTAAGHWSLNGDVVGGLGPCVDLDLGFTPATNLLPLRRLALTEGQ